MLIDADISAFLALVDHAGAEPARGKAPSGDDSQFTNRNTYDYVHSLICIPDGRPFSDIRQLIGLLVTCCVFDHDMGLYRDCVCCLQFGTDATKRFRDFKSQAEWIEAIRVLNDRQFRDAVGFTEGMHAGFERELSVGRAVQHLIHAGYRFRHGAQGVSFEDGELVRCCQSLVHLIRKVGGQRVIEEVFQRIANSTPFIKGRYLLSRPSRSILEVAQPSVPYGYLINLALANLGDPSSRPKKHPKKLQQLMQLATYIVAACDVEMLSPFVHFGQTSESLPHYLRDIVVGDQLFTFRQVSTDDAATIIEGVFRWVEDAGLRSSLGWNIADVVSIARELWKTIPSHSPGGYVDRRSVPALFDRSKTATSLVRALVHESGEVNTGFLTPFDANSLNAFLKPLIRTGPNQLFMLSPPISSMAFYEAIATTLRRPAVAGHHRSNVDVRTGSSIEPMLAAAFAEHQIAASAVSKKYGAFECDIVLESPTTIFLIETKKKPLTRQAQAGHTLQAFADLVGGLMDSQLQLGRHEIQLRTCGRIDFDDGTCVAWNGRRIQRMAVTLLDWGGTQDRVVLRELAMLLVGSSLNSPGAPAEFREILAKINKTLKILGEQQVKLQSMSVDPRSLSAEWWFLSVPQLLFILDGISGVHEFEARLRGVSFTTFGHMDLYRDLYTVQSWKKAVSK